MSTAIVKPEIVEAYENNLRKHEVQIAALLPAGLGVTAEQIIVTAKLAAAGNPVLFDCTPKSLFMAALQAAQLGLQIGVGNSCFLIPYKNKRGQREAHCIPGYSGLIDVATRDRRVVKVEARLIYEGEPYRIRGGTSPGIDHDPAVEEGPCDSVIAAYAVATFDNGQPQFEAMSKKQLDLTRQRSQGRDSPAWSDPENRKEMYRKTVIRRLCKYLPQSKALQRALDFEARAEAGESPAVIAEVTGIEYDHEGETPEGIVKQGEAQQGSEKHGRAGDDAPHKQSKCSTCRKACPPGLMVEGECPDCRKKRKAR